MYVIILFFFFFESLKVASERIAFIQSQELIKATHKKQMGAKAVLPEQPQDQGPVLEK